MQVETAHELLIQSRAIAKRRRDLLKRLTEQKVFWRKNDDIYLPVTLKGRSTQYSQRVAVWSSRFKPDLLHHTCVSRIVENIPEDFVEFTIGPFAGAFVRAVKSIPSPVQVQEKMKMTTVTQEWTHALTLRQQMTLLFALRSPDDSARHETPQKLLRWYRRCVLVSALDDGIVLNNPYDPRGGSVLGPSVEKTSVTDQDDLTKILKDHIREYVIGIDIIAPRFNAGFREAIEILGYKHPDQNIRKFWHGFYVKLVQDLRMNPETEEQMDARSADNIDSWLK